MTSFFNRLFNIRTHEWPRLLFLYLIVFIFIMGSVWGEAIIYASYLKQVGIEGLAWFFIAKALLSIPAVAIYAAFADRVSNDKLLMAILAIGFLGTGVGFVLLLLGFTQVAYFVMYLVAFVPLADIFSIQWYTYVSGFYDVQSFKRVIPVLGTASRVAGILAGQALPFLIAFFSPSDRIILVYLGLLLAVMFLVWLMPRILRKEADSAGEQLGLPSRGEATARGQLGSYLNNLREGYSYVLRSPFLRWMAFAMLLLVVLLSLVQYQSSQILLDELQTEDSLSIFFGQVTSVANLIVLPIQLFLLSRIINRIGVANTSLIFPVGLLLIGGSLIFSQTTTLAVTLTAALAYSTPTLHNTFGAPTNSLLYNAVPLRVKGRARAFIDGLVEPVGSLIGGGLQLLLPLILVGWFLPGLIGLMAVIFIICALVIRRQYTQALVSMLEQEDFSFLLSQEVSELTAVDPATLAQLQRRLRESTSHEMTVFMTKLVSQVGGSKAIPILVQTAREAKDPRTRSAIVDVLSAADFRGEAVHELYVGFLADPEGRVRQSAIAGLEKLAGAADQQFLSRMLEMVRDPDIDVRVQVLSALVRSGEFRQLASAVQVLDELLSDEDAHRRASGVRVLGRVSDEPAISRLAEYLADPSDEVRLEAAVAIESLPPQSLPAEASALVVADMKVLLQDPVERVRQAALTVLGRVGTRETHQALIGALTDASPQVRATAVNVLTQAGKSIVPLVHPKLDSPDSQLRKMAAVTLSRLDPREFGGLVVGTNVMGNLLSVYRNYGLIAALEPCGRYQSIAVLQSALREQNRELADEIFYLLTAVHDPEAVRIVGESMRSDNARARANAAEALESMTSPQIARLTAPLFEPDLPLSQQIAVSEDVWDMQHPTTDEAVRQALTDSDDVQFRMIGTYALGEMGAAVLGQEGRPAEGEAAAAEGKKEGAGRLSLLTDLAAKLEPEEPAAEPEEPPAVQEAPGRSVRRTPPKDLLGAAIGEEPPAVQEEPGRSARRAPPKDLFGAAIGEEPPAKQEEADRSARRAPPKDLFGALMDTPAEEKRGGAEPSAQPQAAAAAAAEVGEGPPPESLPFSLPEIETMVEAALADPSDEVRLAAQAAKRLMAGRRITDVAKEEDILLSTIEKIIFLKEVPFFQGMTVDQLKVLASVCEEELFEEDARIFSEGDGGGVLYVVVNGRVGIEQQKRTGSFARLATIEAHSYFGEMNLFDNSPRTTSAVAIQDTLTLRLRREPLIVLARQHPDLSLELINVLSQRLREANDRVADLTRSRPRELHKLFDQFD